MDNKYSCDNCEWVGDGDTAPLAKSIGERIDPGGTYTDKECPECGALAYPVDEEKEAIRRERINGPDSVYLDRYDLGGGWHIDVHSEGGAVIANNAEQRRIDLDAAEFERLKAILRD